MVNIDYIQTQTSLRNRGIETEESLMQFLSVNPDHLMWLFSAAVLGAAHFFNPCTPSHDGHHPITSTSNSG